MSGEIVFLIIVLLIPAIVGARLARRGRLIAIPAGATAAALLLFVIPNGGGDSPLNIIGAVIGAGVTVGALIAEASAFVLHRVRKQGAH